MLLLVVPVSFCKGTVFLPIEIELPPVGVKLPTPPAAAAAEVHADPLLVTTFPLVPGATLGILAERAAEVHADPLEVTRFPLVPGATLGTLAGRAAGAAEVHADPLEVTRFPLVPGATLGILADVDRNVDVSAVPFSFVPVSKLGTPVPLPTRLKSALVARDETVSTVKVLIFFSSNN
jgi:hypothetical protein